MAFMSKRPNRLAGISGTWTAPERALLRTLRTPYAIQEYLDGLPYSTEPRYRSPRSVISDRKAHCFDGAVFAAAALGMLGDPPVIVDMHAVRDDDHVIAVFRRNGGIGAVAKSNFTGLRFREPVYRTLRELVMSYFESFYNIRRERTLRRHTVPVDLSGFDRHAWRFRDEAMDLIAERLDTVRTVELLTPAMIRNLTPVDERSYRTGLTGADRKGLYIP